MQNDAAKYIQSFPLPDFYFRHGQRKPFTGRISGYFRIK